MVNGFVYWEPGGELLSHGKATLPSPQLRFTSEFEMESGGSTALLPPGKRGLLFNIQKASTASAVLFKIR